MKKVLFVIVCLLFIFECAYTQVQQQNKKPVKFYPLNWHMLSFGTKDSVYGADINKAYEFLEGKERKKKVIVAIIDSGCDDLHEDLKGVLWTNKKEIPGDQVDNDGNGYVDDVHGWNFLATRDGKLIEKTMQEGARAMQSFKDRFEELMMKERTEKEEAEYKRYYAILKKSELGNSLLAVDVSRQVCKKIELVNEELKAKFPGQVIDQEKFMSIVSKTDTDTLKLMSHMLIGMAWQSSPQATWEQMYAMRFGSEKTAREKYQKLVEKQVDERHLVGDNIDNLEDRVYGNAMLLASNSDRGTHVAGIIGAARGNETGMDGIADNVELMIIRAIPSGEEYDKDVALAIRYAVDNGANVINMSFGKLVSPHQDWVHDAMKYAEKNGVLLVHGAGNNNADTDKQPFFPVKQMGKKKALSNFICVGASDPKGQPFISSNYGKESVDIFAPGEAIYSTVPGDNYKKMSGTSMASPVVAGIAAMIMTYYPELSVKQIRDIIIKSAVIRKGENVLLPQAPDFRKEQESVPFANLCVGGGIVSALEAVKLADQLVNRK